MKLWKEQHIWSEDGLIYYINSREQERCVSVNVPFLAENILFNIQAKKPGFAETIMGPMLNPLMFPEGL